MDSSPAGAYEMALRSVLPVGGWGDPLRYLEDTTSTNDQALIWAASGAPEGALVVADRQSAGRGRRGRRWHAAPGSALLFSLVLRPNLSADALGLLTTAFGVAGVGAALNMGVEARVKWPNDVVVGERKLAGVLVESRVLGSGIEVVAGMGINVSGDPAGHREELGGRATSLATELGEAPQRYLVLEAILTALAPLIRSLAAADGAAALVAKASRLSAVLGSSVRVRMADASFVEGTALRLTERGSLVLATREGDIEVSAGEIDRLRPK